MIQPCGHDAIWKSTSGCLKCANLAQTMRLIPTAARVLQTRRAMMKWDGDLLRFVLPFTVGHPNNRGYVFPCANGGELHISDTEIKAHPGWFSDGN